MSNAWVEIVFFSDSYTSVKKLTQVGFSLLKETYNTHNVIFGSQFSLNDIESTRKTFWFMKYA